MEKCDKSNIGAVRQLPIAVQLHILSLLPLNERALSGRLVSPEARDGLTGPQHCTASLSQPLPHYAVPWAQEAGQGYVRQLPYLYKVYLLCTAASSGCETNLEVALALLQPSIFPELLQVYDYSITSPQRDPGVAAVKAGHPQLLGWLLRHCPGLMYLDRALEAAARHCDLAGLQAAWGLLQGVSTWSSHFRATLGQKVLDAAAGSVTPDAVAKVQWVLEAGGSNCRLADSTAEAAARSGNLDALRWLREHGCPLCRGSNEGLLGPASLAVAQWLVDEAGCKLLAWDSSPLAEGWWWAVLLPRIVQGPDAAAKLRWLQERGAPPLGGDSEGLFRLAEAAAKAGRVEVLRHLLLTLGPERVAQRPNRGSAAMPGSYWDDAAMSGSILAMQCLREAGVRFTAQAYERAAGKGHLGVVRWLALEAGVRAKKLVIDVFVASWPDCTPAHSRDLLEAVQLLAGAGCNAWGPGYRLPYHLVLAWGNQDCFWDILARGDLAFAHFVLGQKPGYVPDAEHVRAVVRSGNEALLEWMVQQVDHVETLRGDRLYILAAMNGDRATLAALRRLGVPWGAEDVVVRAVKEGSCMAAVRWLVERGAPVGSREGMEKAITCREQGLEVGDVDAAWLRGLVAPCNSSCCVA